MTRARCCEFRTPVLDRSQWRVTRELVLLTCCPPGPPDLLAVNRSSDPGMTIPSVTLSGSSMEKTEYHKENIHHKHCDSEGSSLHFKCGRHSKPFDRLVAFQASACHRNSSISLFFRADVSRASSMAADRFERNRVFLPDDRHCPAPLVHVCSPRAERVEKPGCHGHFFFHRCSHLSASGSQQ